MKYYFYNFLNYLFFWLGSKLYGVVVLSSKDEDVVDGVLFTNNQVLADNYVEIEYS